MKKRIMLIALLCGLLILTSCGDKNDTFLEVDGVTITLEKMTVQELVDKGFEIKRVELPKSLFLYGGKATNSLYVYAKKHSTTIRIDSRLEDVGNIFDPDIDRITEEAKTIGVITGVRIYLDTEHEADGSYNGIALSQITLDTISEWKCDKRATIIGDQVVYSNEHKTGNVSITFGVEENKETKEIEKINFLWLQ